MNLDTILPLEANEKIAPFRPGDTVRVSYRIREGVRERTQNLQGVVMRKRGGGASATFTIRRMSHGVGVEQTFPFYSPRLEGVEMVRHGKVRRARLYYLRERFGKSARIREGQRVRKQA
jgi:large subunit ribosomal protein L19